MQLVWLTFLAWMVALPMLMLGGLFLSIDQPVIQVFGALVLLVGVMMVLWIQLASYIRRARAKNIHPAVGPVIYFVPVAVQLFYLWAVIEAILIYNGRREADKFAYPRVRPA